MGGENLPSQPVPLAEGGSSPRGRGKLDGPLDSPADRRLIPAWAGKTVAAALRAAWLRAHPRVGGENTYQNINDAATDGSSPRGRGKHQAWGKGTPIIGLIPAWAGKTLFPPLLAGCCWAHPRVGGENRAGEHSPEVGMGSSPRGRGKLLELACLCLTLRLIPAWAGKTRRLTHDSPPSTAHPRVGGENFSAATSSRCRQGSSPRGRGKPTC